MEKNDTQSQVEKERINLIDRWESQFSDDLIRSIKLAYDLSKKEEPHLKVTTSDHNTYA